MSKLHKLIIKPNAIEDIREIKNWYNEQSTSLGDRFTAALDESLTRVARYPNSFTRVYRKLRRINLQKFPFQIFFVFDDTMKCVFVVGVFHTARNPSIWKLKN